MPMHTPPKMKIETFQLHRNASNFYDRNSNILCNSLSQMNVTHKHTRHLYTLDMRIVEPEKKSDKPEEQTRAHLNVCTQNFLKQLFLWHVEYTHKHKHMQLCTVNHGLESANDVYEIQTTTKTKTRRKFVSVLTKSSSIATK